MKINATFKLICIAGCLLSGFCQAQDYSFRLYSSADGLPAQDVHVAMEDSNGFLWIGTGNGVSRFDGKEFKNYGFTEGLQNLAVIAIFEDSRHRLWFGTTKGLAELRGNHFYVHQYPPVRNSRILSIGEFSDLGLVTCTDSGIFQLKDTNWFKLDLVPENKKNCVDILEADGGHYLNFDDAIYFKKKDSKAVVLLKDTSVANENFCNGLLLNNKKVYAGVGNKLYQIVKGRMQVLIDNIPIDDFYRFTTDTANIFWVNIEGKGLFKYQLHPGGKKSVSIFRYDSNTVGLPLHDKHGNLWVTSFEGLIKVIAKPFSDVTPEKAIGTGKRINVVSGVKEEVIISSDSGLHILEGNKLTRLHRPSSYNDDYSYYNDVVEGPAKDSRNFTWLVTRQRKLFCWNGSKMMDYSAGMIPRTTDYIRNLGLNPVNNTVFVCDDSTLLCGNEKKFAVYTDRNGKTFSKTTTVYFTRNGIGLVNVFGKGIYFITRNNEIVKAPSELDIIDKGSYTYFFEDREGLIWISNAGKGLIHFRINENTYKVSDLNLLTTEQGLPSNKIHQMAFDTEGGRWVSCNNGLVVLKHDSIQPNKWDVYTIGIEQNINLLYPVDITTNNLGDVWLASLSRIIRVDAKKLILKKVTPNVAIEKVLLNMKETNWIGYADSVSGYFQLPVSLSLGHAQNTLGIEFTGVSLYNADFFEYAYQLVPVDTSWSAPSSSKFISLVNLSPGKYVFKVKARGKGTEWSEPKEFGFTIRSPFWRTWWFFIIMATIAAFFVGMIFRNRVMKIQTKANIQNQLRELEMKALKAQMNPHFIYNALNSIQSLIADARNSEAINYIGTFSRLLRQVLDHSDSNVISLEKELQTLHLYIQLESLRLNMQLEFNVTTDDDLLPEDVKVPPLILQPFVENALWHGLSRKKDEKRLSVSISQTSTALVITIDDNGIGRASAATFKKQSSTEIYSSKGIAITEKRLMDFNRSPESPVIYHDMFDTQGNPAGTRVVVTINKL